MITDDWSAILLRLGFATAAGLLLGLEGFVPGSSRHQKAGPGDVGLPNRRGAIDRGWRSE